MSAPAEEVRKVRVVVGAMRQIVPETLAFAYEVLTKETPLAGTELEIVPVPVKARCRACDWTGPIEDAFFICPTCEAVDLEVLAGMELYLDSIEIEAKE